MFWNKEITLEGKELVKLIATQKGLVWVKTNEKCCKFKTTL